MPALRSSSSHAARGLIGTQVDHSSLARGFLGNIFSDHATYYLQKTRHSPRNLQLVSKLWARSCEYLCASDLRGGYDDHPGNSCDPSDDGMYAGRLRRRWGPRCCLDRLEPVSSHLASPPSPGSQAPAIIPAVTTSQQFAVMGASQPHSGDQTPHLAAGDQLQVRYVQSSNSYEVQVPNSQTWTPIAFISQGLTQPTNFGGDPAYLWLRSGGYQYSRLFAWSDKT